jgi:ribose 5-phosphate isomerase B
MSYKIFIASDHRGFKLKKEFLSLLSEKFDIFDCGTFKEEQCDYPDFAHNAILKMEKEDLIETKLILICGSGVGMSIVANRYSFIRALLYSSIKNLKLAREHNNVNALCIGANDFKDDIYNVVNIFLETKFENGRHQERISKINLK